MAIIQDELDQLSGQSVTLAAKKVTVVARELKDTGDRIFDAANAHVALMQKLQAEGNRVSDGSDSVVADMGTLITYVNNNLMDKAATLAATMQQKATALVSKVSSGVTNIFNSAQVIIDHTVETSQNITTINSLAGDAKKTIDGIIKSSGTVTLPTEVNIDFTQPAAALQTALNVNIMSTALASQVDSFTSHLSAISGTINGSLDISNQVNSVANDMLSNVTQANIQLSIGGVSLSANLQGISISMSGLQSSIQSYLQGKIDGLVNTAQALVNRVTNALGLSKLLKSKSADVSQAATMAIGKLMGKYKPDLPFFIKRPISKGDATWPTPPGSELAKEARAIANHEPTVRIWNKSAKGHSLHVDDQDGVERMTLTDRSGSVFSFDAPVKLEENFSNKEQRGSRSVLTNNPIERSKLRDGGGKITIQDLAQSQLEFDSRQQFEKITITANDGESGVQNGKNRQKIEIMVWANRTAAESVKDGKVLARLVIDSNTGMITLESDTFLTLVSPYITLNGDHINLNGRVCVNGDMVISGRITGGSS